MSIQLALECARHSQDDEGLVRLFSRQDSADSESETELAGWLVETD